MQEKMNWMDKVLVNLFAYLYLLVEIIPSYASTRNIIYDDHHGEERNTSSEGISLEKYIELLSSLMMEPWQPLVDVENEINHQFLGGLDDRISSESSKVSGNKRSKYYRKYPLKGLNVRSRSERVVECFCILHDSLPESLRYEAENRYWCLPSKTEVYKLLMALRGTRHGKRSHTVNLCNRKRPARAVLTNIRFVGK